MDYEKKYKDALERARNIRFGNPSSATANVVCEEIFPELKKSEDEKIRIFINNSLCFIPDVVWENNNVTKEELIAWIEKQGEHANFRNKIQIGDEVTRNEDGMLVNFSQLERVAKPRENQRGQKPANKIEPKFKVGDWITNGTDFTFKVMLIEDDMYYRDDDYFIDIETADKTFRLWTIEDAKDGDVMVYEGEIFMIKSYALWNKVVYHCCYDWKNLHKDSVYYSWGKEDFDKVHPATKEQRELLFSKMKEAGYEWDADKKELTKIEQKPAWSEEDDRMIRRIKQSLFCYKDKVCGCSLYDDVEAEIDWLKSLKPQPYWKPTEEQLRFLIGLSDNPGLYLEERKSLEELYNDLKKL